MLHSRDKARIVRRHFLTERFLTDLLGLDWVKAHQEAHRLEHAISQDVERVTGRKATSFEQFARDYRDAFRGDSAVAS